MIGPSDCASSRCVVKTEKAVKTRRPRTSARSRVTSPTIAPTVPLASVRTCAGTIHCSSMPTTLAMNSATAKAIARLKECIRSPAVAPPLTSCLNVMAGLVRLVPAIYAAPRTAANRQGALSWSWQLDFGQASRGVDGRDEPAHDHQGSVDPPRPLLRCVGPRRRRGVVSVLLDPLRLLAGLPGRFGKLIHFLMLVVVECSQRLVGVALGVRIALEPAHP